MPMWLAPNLITLVGLIGLVIAYVLHVVYLPTYAETDAPSWVYLVTSLSILLYVNLDCMDGKQARRTGSSSPLGQLFDHGCDALAVHLVISNVQSSLGFPCGVRAVLGSYATMWAWMMAQWEEYHTGIMLYGNGTMGVLEANYSICAIHAATWLLGPSLWRMKLPALLPAARMAGDWATIEVREAATIVVGIACLVESSERLGRVLIQQRGRQLSDEDRGHKQLGCRASLAHLALLLLLFGVGGVYMASPSCSSDARGRSWPPLPPPQADATASWAWEVVCLAHCRTSVAAVGLTYALWATQLIVAHMAKEPWMPSLWPLLLLLLGVANLRLQYLPPPALAAALTLLLLASYLHYVVSVIQQICNFLAIPCLTIKPKA